MPGLAVVYHLDAGVQIVVVLAGLGEDALRNHGGVLLPRIVRSAAHLEPLAQQAAGPLPALTVIARSRSQGR